jgi:hypothetical protein
MKNPLTTIFGLLAAIGAAVAHYFPGTVGEIGTLVSIGATALLGGTAKDSTTSN